jgi:hypothetical protein
MIRIQEILDKVTESRPNADVALIQKAYVFSAAAHAGQTRLSGEPYLSHPLSVAYKLAELRMDEATICAGLLHDTVEDTTASIEDIDAQFGENVADIVDGVTKISLMTFDSKEQAQAENIRKMILAMAEDIRVLVVKLADRMHNMSTLDFQKPHKQKLIAQETLDIYVPLANRLGLHRIKLELEDLSFKYLKPDIFNSISEWLENNQKSGTEYMAPLFHLSQDGSAEPYAGSGARHHCLPRYRGRCEAVLCHSRPCACHLEAGSRAFQGLHLHAQGQHVPEPAHDCDRAGGRAHRDSDPYERDGPAGRTWSCLALAV